MTLNADHDPHSIGKTPFRTTRDLRRNKLSIHYKCLNCENSGIIDLRQTLLSNDEPVSLFNELTCEHCKIGKLECSYIDQEPLKKSLKGRESIYQNDADTMKWHLEHYDQISKLALKIFTKNELTQFSRLDTVGLFYAIENLIKKTSFSELNAAEARKMKESILWFREFDKNNKI